MNIKTMADIRALKPCYDLARYLSEDWAGTALDILKTETCPAVDRLWVVLNDGWIDERTMRLFACDCAEHVLHLYEQHCPGDKRPRRTIKVARHYANGEETTQELSDAFAASQHAHDEAWYDAHRTARPADDAGLGAAEAAWAAAWSAVAHAHDAAWYAAYGAVGAAVYATGASARPAERKWQVERLMQYLQKEVIA